MNSRTLILIGAVALLGIGLLLTVGDLFSTEAPEPRVQVAYAARAIEPYTIITQDMLGASEPMPARDARDQAAYPQDAIPGKMSTKRISPGELLTTENALPPEDVRFVKDLNLEIVTFGAGVDRLVGGELRPGHVVNLYGTGRDDETREDFTVLIEPRLWVVGVTAGSSSQYSQATRVPDLETGDIIVEGDPSRDRPVTMVTVAVPPETAFKIVDALGARRLNPYVTLAANQTVDSSFATPASLATPTAGLPPNLALTATALYEALQSTPPPPPPSTGGGAGK